MNSIEKNPLPIKSKFHLNLRERRILSGYSQMEIALKMGYNTPQFISNWERGISSPPMKNIVAIAELYNWPLIDLWNDYVSFRVEDLKINLEKKIERILKQREKKS